MTTILATALIVYAVGFLVVYVVYIAYSGLSENDMTGDTVMFSVVVAAFWPAWILVAVSYVPCWIIFKLSRLLR